MKEITAKEEYWKRYGKVTYKNQTILITPLERAKDDEIFYIGEFRVILKPYTTLFSRKTIESIHYDRVVSRFQRFVDEYCTEWQARADVPYKGYTIKIDQERDKEFYIGYVQFHKNSTYKHIADTREEVERCCKNRIGKVIYEKEKVQRKMLTPKQEKIQELEQLQARISTQLEELKKEKDTLTYKGVVLEYGKEGDWLVGRIRNAPKGTKELEANHDERMKEEFEKYIDELEKSATIYHQLMKKYTR